jgi:hypothetical protein
MIGVRAAVWRWRSRAVATGVLAALLLGAILAARPASAPQADPTIEADRQAQLLLAVAQADAALERLQGDLERAVDAARHGAAQVVSGDEAPEPALAEAATLLEAARSDARVAFAAASSVGGTLACARPGTAALALGGVVPDQLASIATQLRASASAGAEFVERRWATEATLTALSNALAALDRDDPGAALSALDDADAALGKIVDWEKRPPSLGYWLQTTAELLAAARGIADAAIAQDPAAAATAAGAYRAAADKAVDADRSRELAMAEAGSAITVVPLQRLAASLRELVTLRAAVTAIVDGSQ